ncbi:hypothetical protein GTR04_7338 [Trichophyton interdigitale]|nr:hypothetical protein GY631_7337 [Trichophyton interdigitale]KAG5216749.1 hypothetical protein GY632_7243 [Trichophyton interdigitale]KAG8205282.1 hypothetical protein GTR04_7338 [Trichophyton interdigitale]
MSCIAAQPGRPGSRKSSVCLPQRQSDIPPRRASLTSPPPPPLSSNPHYPVLEGHLLDIPEVERAVNYHLRHHSYHHYSHPASSGQSNIPYLSAIFP